jgi:predicted acetyltransferase
MADFRPVPATDRDELRRILRYGFAPERGPEIPDPSGEWPPTLFEQRGLYDGETLVGACRLYVLDARLRGTMTTLGGLGAVAVPPERRGQGYARQLCRQALLEYRESGVGFVVLWPVSVPLYRGFGWATANKYARFEFHPGELPAHAPQGRFGPLEADDWKRLRRVETAYGEGRALSIRRSEQWWRERTLADWDGSGTPYCYGYERDGHLRGYVIFTVEDDGHRTLSVQDLAHADEEAHRALLSFLGGHGAQIERVVLRRAADADLLDRVEDPADVECRLKVGPMVRLTDVRALEGLEWSARADLDCVLSVEDTLVSDNSGRFRLSIEAGSASVERTETATEAPAGTVNIGTLSQLAVGTHGIDAAERVRGLEIADDAVRDGLATVFEPGPVGLREYF